MIAHFESPANFRSACSVKDERMHEVDQSNVKQGAFSNQSAGKPLEDYSKRHRRGKSETLRLQYISTKDVRVTIGTWNVAGRLPDDELHIDEWLCMQEPADIFILGFQEVVPLNAGNVLGAENRRSIPKWEGIIRKTLNKTLEPETRPKSYSAPPSPDLRNSSAADVLAVVADNPVLEMMEEDTADATEVCDSGITGPGMKIRLKRIYGIDCDNRLDWPERSLDATPQLLSTNIKLRRVLSSSARVGSAWLEKSPTSSPQNVASKGCGLKRVHHSSGNLGLLWLDHLDGSKALDSLSDEADQISGDEDDSFAEFSEVNLENIPLRDVARSHQKYVRIVSKQMVGIYVSVWVRKRLRRHINNLKVSPVGVGLMGYMGNKGSVSVSMSLFQSRLCFVCSHLTSGQKDGAEHRRNSDVHEIIRRTRFSSVFDIDQPKTIPSHDQIFWFGDLNYRINMLDTEVRKLVSNKQWSQLLNSDQLIKELRSGHVFDGWKEGLINFAPTYKYEIGSDRYVGENPKDGEKKRSPAWCDRILWFGKGIKQLLYKRTEIRLSDHRPVSSTFLVEVEIFNQRKLQKALTFSTAAVHPEIFLDESGEI